MTRDVSIGQLPPVPRKRPASHASYRLVSVLPFISAPQFGINLQSNLVFQDSKIDVLGGVHSKNSREVGSCLLSFCETLAAHTLQQGLEEGRTQIIKSNLLSVHQTKLPRRIYYHRSCKIGEGPNTDLSQSDSDVNLSVTIEATYNKNEPQEMNKNGRGSNGATDEAQISDTKTNGDVELVGLNVLALEAMNSKASCSQVIKHHDRKQNAHESLPKRQGVFDIVRSATDYDFQSKKPVTSQYNSQGCDPCSIYDICEFPVETSNNGTGATRSASIAGYPSHTPAEVDRPQPPAEMAAFLEEPLLLVGPKLEWAGNINKKRSSNTKRRKRRQQQMTPQELNKMTRVVIGYTLAFFLLVIITFYIVYFL